MYFHHNKKKDLKNLKRNIWKILVIQVLNIQRKTEGFSDNDAVIVCTRSLTDRTKASDAFNAGSIPVGCISTNGLAVMDRSRDGQQEKEEE